MRLKKRSRGEERLFFHCSVGRAVCCKTACLLLRGATATGRATLVVVCSSGQQHTKHIVVFSLQSCYTDGPYCYVTHSLSVWFNVKSGGKCSNTEYLAGLVEARANWETKRSK
jgi:hypothetical protein